MQGLSPDSVRAKTNFLHGLFYIPASKKRKVNNNKTQLTLKLKEYNDIVLLLYFWKLNVFLAFSHHWVTGLGCPKSQIKIRSKGLLICPFIKATDKTNTTVYLRCWLQMTVGVPYLTELQHSYFVKFLFIKTITKNCINNSVWVPAVRMSTGQVGSYLIDLCHQKTNYTANSWQPPSILSGCCSSWYWQHIWKQ